MKTWIELTDHAIEEASELIQALVKCKRFGFDNYHPVTKVSNEDHLEAEWHDLINRMNDLIEARNT